MNHRTEAYRYFIPVSLIYLAYYLWNQTHGGTIPSEWILSGLWSAMGFGLIWSLFPKITRTELPTMNELVPMVMLMIFLLVLISIGQKTGTGSLTHTVGALLFFRTLLFVLKGFRSSTRSVAVSFAGLSLGLVLGLVSQSILLTASFKGFSTNMISFAEFFSAKGSLLLCSVSLLYGFKKNTLAKNHT